MITHASHHLAESRRCYSDARAALAAARASLEGRCILAEDNGPLAALGILLRAGDARAHAREHRAAAATLPPPVAMDPVRQWDRHVGPKRRRRMGGYEEEP